MRDRQNYKLDLAFSQCANNLGPALIGEGCYQRSLTDRSTSETKAIAETNRSQLVLLALAIRNKLNNRYANNLAGRDVPAATAATKGKSGIGKRLAKPTQSQKAKGRLTA
jgi:hypothetical protein